ncbi:hypothetical protein FKW77_003148 [Venturia effusa]|uniref:RNase H type-1 domain-containing protein n=1 Tax=Venturia effusa TaxID=50376 RepID=A0A517L8W5_9PEZI|nr:hypothetical protein FKW77_003148 [Venturia effusa]
MSRSEGGSRGHNIVDRLIKDGQAQRAREAEAALLAENQRKMRRNAKSKIYRRKFEICQARREYNVNENIVECHKCHDFSIWCCSHSKKKRTNPAYYHYRVLMVAGACSGNDGQSARAALGIVWGQDAQSQYSHAIALDSDLDRNTTSQRAEVWAATWGLQFFANIAEADWIIATSSSYVFEGITERLPVWKAKGSKMTSGKLPADIDLFLNLDKAINELESRLPCTIGFWYIPEMYNLASDLAREGAGLEADRSAPEKYHATLTRANLEVERPSLEKGTFLERLGYSPYNKGQVKSSSGKR